MPRARKVPTADPTSVKRAVVYARVSSKEQRDEGYSIDSQLATLSAYCVAKGITVAETIIEAETAKETGRPGFNRILSLLKAGQVNAVVVEKTDRLYRNMKDRVLIGELAPDIHLVKESTVISRTSRSHELFIHDIKLVVAKNYIDNLSEETKKGLAAKAASGVWPGPAPLGYVNTLDGARRVITRDSQTSAKVRRIFDAYSTGDYSFERLAGLADQIGLRSARGLRIRKNCIQWILRNPIYAGIVRFNGVDYDGIHEPIISRAEFANVLSIMAGRNPTKVSKTRGEYIYRGLIRCASCGCLMSPYTAKGKFVYYACTGAKGCKRVNYREELISQQFAELLARLVVPEKLLGILRHELRASFDTIRAEDAKTVEFLTARKKRLESSLEALYLDKLAGEVDAETFARLKAALSADVADVSSQLVTAEAAKLATWQQTADFVETVSNSRVRFERAEKAEKRAMFESAVSNSVIQDGKLVVTGEFWFETMLELTKKDPAFVTENEVRTVWVPRLVELLTRSA